MLDGNAKVLNSNEFYKTVTVNSECLLREAEMKEKQRLKRVEYTSTLAAWKADDELQKNCNKERHQQHLESVNKWKVEVEVAKGKHWKPCWNKPKSTRIESPTPHPKLVVEEDAGDNSSSDDGDSDSVGDETDKESLA